MGGKNHQPTSTRLTSVSAWLSQQIGRAQIAVIQANDHLEDAIMIGMGPVHLAGLTDAKGDALSHLAHSIEQLRTSLVQLDKVALGFGRLQDAARLEGYTGNPLGHILPRLALKGAFDATLICPRINESVWDELERRIQSDNILATLRWEAEQFETLRQPTEDLIATLRQCDQLARRQGAAAMAYAIENNEVPLRQHYARVFSLWNSLDAMFLYSALIMTELYYRAGARPSLMRFDPGSCATTAA